MIRGTKNRLAPLYSMAMVLLALVALIYAIAALPIDGLDDIQFQSLGPWVVPAAIVIHMTYLLLSAEVWRRMVQAVSGRLGRFSDAYLQMASVAAGKYIPGKVWGFVARTGQLNRIEVPAQMSVISTIIEQLILLAGGSMVIFLAVLVAFPDYATVVVVAGIALVILLLVVFRHVPAVLQWLQRRKGNGSVALPDVVGGVGRWFRFSVAYSILWLLNAMLLCVIYFSLFDAQVTMEKVAALTLANTVGFIVGFVAIFAPGGIGVREATTVAVLAPFFPLGEALIATIALRAWMVLFDGINAVILLAAELRRAARGA